MSKQVLDIQQMQHLKDLGVDTSNASCYIWDAEGKEYIYWGKCNDKNGMPVFTLQDILDLLPIYIDFEYSRHELRIKRMIFGDDKVMYSVIYEAQDYTNWYVMQSYEVLIDAAYEMLCWCIENGYVKTNKEE